MPSRPRPSPEALVRSKTTVVVLPETRRVGASSMLEAAAKAAGFSVRVADAAEGATRAVAVARVLARVETPYVVLHDSRWTFSPTALDALLGPLTKDELDGVFASRGAKLTEPAYWGEKALAVLGNLVAEQSLTDPLSGLAAFRTEALKAIPLSGRGIDLAAELLVKLSAQLYRLGEVEVEGATPPAPPTASAWLARMRTLLRYATVQNAGDNQHEGYNTLIRMEGARRYNEWLAARFRPHLGQRVLEIGAGIGTITRHIEQGRELLIALEVDGWYIERLKNAFRGKPHIRPYLSDVALADWKSLAKEKLDSILLSNVLEHIPDDAAAVRRFGDILPRENGKLVVLVPAVEALFGSMDEAVGHHRRYTPETLRRVLEDNGFEVESLEWMNLVGMPGWFVNGRLFKRRSIPALQLRLYDAVAPLLARAESHVKLPIGMSLLAVARKADGKTGKAAKAR